MASGPQNLHLVFMTEKKIYPLAIIGGGAAGTMAALRAVLNNDEVLVFPGHHKVFKKSRDLWINRVENMPTFASFKKGIQDPNRQTLKWIQESKFKDGFHYQKGRGIVRLTKEADGLFLLVDDHETSYRAKYVILCTGVMDVQPTIGGSHQPILPYANAQRVEYCARCDGHHTHGHDTVILGHNNGAASVACLLAERYSHPSMTILTNGETPEFNDENKTLLEKYEISVNRKVIKEVVGDAKKGDLQGFRLADDSFVRADIAFVSLGMIVYNDLAKNLGARLDERGFVITDEKGQSSVAGLYVAGDLRAGLKKQIYTAWDSAVDSADAINALLRAERRRKVLENSAGI